jgi:ABC-2 type transport system ATP-binding protein
MSSDRPTMAVTSVGLTKRFGNRLAVDGVDLAIPAGSVCGFVGPNGAGKTTTLRMLLGLIRPTSGTGTVLGRPLTDPASYLERVGALIEAPAFYPALSGERNLLVLTRLAGLDSSIIEPTLHRVGLGERADDSFRSYSQGMKQRLGIAAALLVTPSLLLLDEPTNGLDPAGILEMRGLVRSLSKDGITVLVSSHLLAEVEQICNHLVMIRDGQLVYQGSVDDLDASHTAELTIRAERYDQTTALHELITAAGLRAHLADDLQTIVVEADGSWAARVNRMAMSADITLVELAERHRSLEEAFFAMTGTHTGDTVADNSLGEIE